MKRNQIAIIIPAHNEELVIARTLEALSGQIETRHVYLIDDGSKDQTANFAKQYLPKNRVLTIKNGGKAHAIGTGIKKFNLTERYDYIMIHDADTRMQSGFIEYILEVFNQDENKQIACVMGQVITDDHNWVTSYRVWEYAIGQLIHKQAQSLINAITVSPGCSSVYRSEVFIKTEMPTGTVTEDMDLTFEIHRQNIGKLVYQPLAKMQTQDPGTLRDYYKQVQRWYGGFWQCVFKHNIPWGGQKLDFEVALMAFEGLLQPLIFFLTLLIGIQYYFTGNVDGRLSTYLIIDLLVFVMPTIIWASLISKRYKLPMYVAHFYLLRTFSGLVFLYAFIREIHRYGLRHKSGWSTNRYTIEDESQSDPILINGSSIITTS